MKPLKIAILWHFHQPYYLKDEIFLLPWVRLHGVKSYWDLPEMFFEFPNLKQNINIVPSLAVQIDEYINKGRKDKIQLLTEKQAESLTVAEKNDILKLFFLCNYDNMIKPYPRYHELYLSSRNTEFAILNFSPQDWRDLQVWYNLTWIGYSSRERSLIKRLFIKQRDFTEQEKFAILDIHLDILTHIKNQLLALKNLNQIEISATPFYHPILPLLCDSASALEALPNCQMPDEIFKFPEDATRQISKSMKYFEENFHFTPSGMWPSEGSLSNKVLELFIEQGIHWVASDEGLLAKTLGQSYKNVMKYFPINYKTPKGQIKIFFRDHILSDKIGFVYSKWDAKDATNDFISNLIFIKSEIINTLGENVLDSAVVPIILDGENCWEYYFQEGIYFRRELFSKLTNSDEFETVNFSDVLHYEDKFPSIDNLIAGSWINGNFQIWIGHEEKRKAWSFLANARKHLENIKDKLSENDYNKALEELLIAEGSDWFWWYGDEHSAKNKPDFNDLFRYHLKRFYEIINEKIPEELNIPIGKYEEKQILVQQKGEVYPIIDGKLSESEKWINAGYYNASSSMTTMHQVGEIIHRIWFASDEKNLYFRLDTTKKLEDLDIIELDFIDPVKFKIKISYCGFKIISNANLFINNCEFAKSDLIEFAISRSIFQENKILNLKISTESRGNRINYPQQGNISIELY